MAHPIPITDCAYLAFISLRIKKYNKSLYSKISLKFGKYSDLELIILILCFLIKINCSAKLFQFISVLFLLFTSRHLLHPAVWLQALYPDRFSIFSDGILYSVKCE